MSPFKSILVTFSLLPALIAGAIVCPRDNNLTTPKVRNTQYKIQCGIDRVGGDLPGMPLWLPNADECIAACTSNSKCVAAVYIPPSSGNAPCYLKETLSNGVSNPSHLSAVKVETDNTCPSEHNKFTVINRDTSYRASCSWGFVDNDPFHQSATISPDFPSCLSACESYAENYEKCRFVTFSPGRGISGEPIPTPGGKCAFHNKVKAAPVNTAVMGGTRISTCPDQNGNTIRVGSKSFKVECYKDRLGGNLNGVESIWTESSRDCIIKCGAISGCKGVSWHWGFPQGRCHFKGDISIPLTADEEVYGASLVAGNNSDDDDDTDDEDEDEEEDDD